MPEDDYDQRRRESNDYQDREYDRTVEYRINRKKSNGLYKATQEEDVSTLNWLFDIAPSDTSVYHSDPPKQPASMDDYIERLLMEIRRALNIDVFFDKSQKNDWLSRVEALISYFPKELDRLHQGVNELLLEVTEEKARWERNTSPFRRKSNGELLYSLHNGLKRLDELVGGARLIGPRGRRIKIFR